MLHPNFVIVATIINFIGALGYIIDTIKGKIKPNRISYLLWFIAPLIAFAAQIKQGVGIESLLTLATGIMPFIIFIATFINKKAEWKLTWFDFLCGFLSLVGLVLWLMTNVGNLAIVFSILADGLAAVPTVVKAYKYPNTEVAWPWFAAFFSVVITLLTIKELSFANSGFIIYYGVLNALIFSLVQFKVGEKTLQFFKKLWK